MHLDKDKETVAMFGIAIECVNFTKICKLLQPVNLHYPFLYILHLRQFPSLTV